MLQIFSHVTLRQQQTGNILAITFWSSFSSHALHSVLVLFLTRPILLQGLNYSEAKAYAFIGVSQAAGYLMPVLGGFMADNVFGIRRAVLLGTSLIAIAYLLIVISGLTISSHGDILFIAAYALLPACGSLLIGTSSGIVSSIYRDNNIEAKMAMNYYYMAINIGALLATIIAPSLLDSRYGPLSVLAFAFVGKSIAALNFLSHLKIYDDVVINKDKKPLSIAGKCQLSLYIAVTYLFTMLAYFYVTIANYIIMSGCVLGIAWFIFRTLKLPKISRRKQLIALVLILEAIVFFIIYDQMNTTLVLFAKSNSDLNLLGLHLSPAQYQLLNPLLIIIVGSQLPRFYKAYPRFSIPYQFAAGTLLAAFGLMTLAFAATKAHHGLVNGNYIGLTYVLISLAELWVSAIGLSMIGLYCDKRGMGFAMGIWYVSSSLSNTLSGKFAAWVAIPKTITSPIQSLLIYQRYYWTLGLVAFILGLSMFFIAQLLQRHLRKKGIKVM